MKTNYWILALAIIFITPGCVDKGAQQASKDTAKVLSDPVRVVSVKPLGVADLAETVDVTGDITAGEDTNVGAKSPGRVVAVYVRDGDIVRKGQLLAQLDTASLVAQLQQADAQVSTALASEASAQASLAQALKNQEVGPLKSSTLVRQAKAQLRSAEANLAKVQAGARPQERIQAQANVNSAKSNLETQQKELRRIQTLVNQGALAGNKLDQQQNAVASAQAQYDNAVQSFNLIQVGSREEDINSAREAVRSAAEALRTAQESKQLDPLLSDQVSAAKAQISSARAQLQTAKAQVAIAKQAIGDAQIVAPFNGKVYGRPIQAGTIAGTGTSIVRLIGTGGVYLNGQVSSDRVALITNGLPAQISLDAIPGKIFGGRVDAVSPLAETVGRLFNVRIHVDDAPEIKPGMFAKASIRVRTIRDASVVPDQAVLHEGDKSYVFVVHGDKADRLEVQIGLQRGSMTQVTGVPAGSTIVISGHETLSPGAKIRIDKTGATASNGSNSFGG